MEKNCVVAKNGFYGNLVTMVRDAFLKDDLVRIDCEGLEKSDYKKIGVKLRVIVSFLSSCYISQRFSSNIKMTIVISSSLLKFGEEK